MSEKPNGERLSEREAKREAKRAKKEEKHKARLLKHAVDCPHCGKSVLDHMTECPYCGGKLDPAGYRPVNAERHKKIKTICYIAGIAAAVVVVVLIFVFRNPQ